MTAAISEARLEANRANSRHSTGSITDEGRAASRINAGRPLITAAISLLPDADLLLLAALAGTLVTTCR